MLPTCTGPVEGMFAQCLRRLANFTLAGQKYQHVSRANALRLVDSIDDGVVQIAFLVLAVSCTGRQRISIGYSRPDTSITGALLKCREKRLASSVAEVQDEFSVRCFSSSCFK